MSKEDIDRDDLDEDEEETSHQRRRGWWSQNWRWFLPALLLAIVVLGGGAIYWALFTRVFHLGVVQSAMQAIQQSAEVDRALGQPITPVRWGVPPSTRLETDEQDVRWEIEGPQGKAKAHVHARMQQGQWATDVLEVTLANGQRLTVAVGGDGGSEAAPFNASKPEEKKPEEKKSESKAPPPEINLPIPPDPGK
jgi:hypothetical protein